MEITKNALQFMYLYISADFGKRYADGIRFSCGRWANGVLHVMHNEVSRKRNCIESIY